MQKIVCYKCNNDVDETASFCPNCGCDLSIKDIKCSKCGKTNSINSKFCEKCGAKLKKDKETWNFDSKLITITFWLCAIFTIYLLSCPGFIKTINFFKVPMNPILGFVLIGFGLSISLFFNKEKINIKNEINNVKNLKLSKVQIGFLFVVAGLLSLLGLGSDIYGERYLDTIFIVFILFIIMNITIIYKNKHKFASMGQPACLIFSIICFILSGVFYNEGNSMNSSYESQFESFWNNGTANPGNEYLAYSRYALIGGILFLVIFFIIRTSKKKKIGD